ncbi:hypothetical protein U9M48_015340 [Paspalum notatum var. saurae]|uniref:Uncharacterized protein n=1 Tax=Paspalum notatum var. saurae TaxID=547442 RepID=A0AAQ3WLW7_PASNO
MVLGKKRRWGGSVVGHEVKNRESEEVNAQIMRDYFNDPPLYGEEHFRRRFRMRKSLFLRIVEDVTVRNKYFKQKRNAAKKKGFTPIHECLVALRMLAYGGVADALDDTYKMAETTVLKTLMQFVHTVIDVYEKEYLRPPRAHELEVILKQNEARGFPSMVGSIDCMHWEWKNCPTALAGMYKGHKSKPTVILEAMATQDLRIWHAFFGLPGSHNDINVLHRSPVFDDLANGRTPEVEYWINVNPYNMGYYLADGIYPAWATLVKTISAPVNMRQKIFAAAQESCRKDVERAFGVLQTKFKIIHNPARLWNPIDLNAIMRACVILHNMVIEDERNIYNNPCDTNGFKGPEAPAILENRDVPQINELIDAYNCIKNKETNSQLQHDLVEHLWSHFGASTGPFG